MNTSDVLNKAADEIETRGWGQGWQSWGVCETDICLEQALAKALGHVGANLSPQEGGIWVEDLEATPAYIAVASHLGYRPYRWNDSPDRTAAEVIEVLRATAVIEAARESEAAELVTIEVASDESARAEL